MDNSRILRSIVSTVLTNSVCRWRLAPKLPVLSTVARSKNTMAHSRTLVGVLAVKNFVSMSVRNDLSSDTIQNSFVTVSASSEWCEDAKDCNNKHLAV